MECHKLAFEVYGHHDQQQEQQEQPKRSFSKPNISHFEIFGPYRSPSKYTKDINGYLEIMAFDKTYISTDNCDCTCTTDDCLTIKHFFYALCFFGFFKRPNIAALTLNFLKHHCPHESEQLFIECLYYMHFSKTIHQPLLLRSVFSARLRTDVSSSSMTVLRDGDRKQMVADLFERLFGSSVCCQYACAYFQFKYLLILVYQHKINEFQNTEQQKQQCTKTKFYLLGKDLSFCVSDF